MRQSTVQRFKKHSRTLFFLGALLVIMVVVAVIAGALVYNGKSRQVTVRFSEIMTSNSSYPDANGLFPDWVELVNYGEDNADLGGFTVSDDSEKTGYMIPHGTVLKPGDYLVIYCLKNSGSGYASFGLSASGGETVTLKNPYGVAVDSVTTFSLQTDQSMIPVNGEWRMCEQPSPGYENTPEGHAKVTRSDGSEITASDLKLEITELVAKNAGGVKDSDGAPSDWIELTNVSGAKVSLKGVSVTNSVSEPHKWMIRSEKELEPGESVIIFCSGKNRSESDELHTSFKLSSDGESVWVFDSSARLICTVSYPQLMAGESWQKDESGTYQKTFAQTPGRPGVMSEAEKNTLTGKIVINELCASYTVGKAPLFDGCPDWIELKNLSSEPVDISGCWLTDDGVHPEYPLSGTIPGGGCLLVLCDVKPSEGVAVCEFSLAASGETVTLMSPWGSEIDRVEYSSLDANFSLARNSSGERALCADPTPGFDNSAAGLEAYYAAADSVGDVVINEVMVNNGTVLPQSYGKCYDWIEVKNISDKSLDLTGWSLSDSRKRPGAWKFEGVTLSPGECYVVLASGKPELSGSAYKHTPFDLSSSGDSVFLFDPQGALVDCLFAAQLPAGASYGRMDGSKGFFYFASPTPGSSNTNGKRAVAESPVFSSAPGAYDGVDSVQLTLLGDGNIYYTTDGSAPSRASTLYTGAFTVDKTTVIRAFSAAEGKLDSPVTSGGFFINEGHTLPIVSVCVNPTDLWDYNTGIYVSGPGAAEAFPHRGANYYKDWEKAANVSFYDDRGDGFSIDCGLKIFGNTGRALDKKSFQIKFKKQYGASKLVYPVFDNTEEKIFDSLVLRSGSQDYQSSLIRDALVSQICTDGMPETGVQAYRYCVLYLNGQYWGVYCFREKLDEDYVAAHYNADPDDVNVLGYQGAFESGSSKGYRELISYISSHDMSSAENYAWVSDRMCFESYIDWFIMQAYVGNNDLDNVREFSVNTGDGKWRWMLYDFDLTFYNSTRPYSYLCSPPAYADVSMPMRALVKNSSFRELFLTQLGQRLKTVLSDENVLKTIDHLYELIKPEMERERTRWDMTYSGWERSVESMRNYVRGKDGVSRSQQFINDVKSVFSLSDEQVRKYFG